ncbi:MAG: SMC-Scp complex subunit ScpB [Elusimicrobia bacterium]|nr:SMC-Scp complex subunit ScpB [Elusimicrobiota bacterium]
MPQLPSKKDILETLLFITDRPVALAELAHILQEEQPVARTLIQDLRREYAQRKSPIQILEVAGGFQMATRPEYVPQIRQLYQEKMTTRLTTAGLETLSIITYRQPITRAEIEQVRGVEVIASLETLLEKRLIAVVGRKETIGRPLLYGTTEEFLKRFGLNALKDLPPFEKFLPQKEQTAAPAVSEPTVPVTPADPPNS